jgi:DNA-directed RNA polymerase specialized sigma24 family protein
MIQSSDEDGFQDRATLCVIMQGVTAGDSAAFSALYEMTVSILFAFARRVLHNGADVEEVVCDVYMQAWQRGAQYK